MPTEDNKKELNNFLILEKDLKELNIPEKQYTFLNVINQNPHNENLISDWLAFIFNPNINGVGIKPMLALLKAVNKDNVDIEKQKFICIERETCTDNKKRMDLLIKYSTTWIVIENKINAHETGIQTNEYYEYIHKMKDDKDVIYIYLKPTYNQSNPSSKIFIELGYDKLIQEFGNIKKDDYKENEEYKYRFLKEFEIVRGDNFMNENNYNIDEETQVYIKNAPIIKRISSKYEKKNNILINEICEKCVKVLGRDNAFEFTVKNGWGVIQIYKDEWKNNNLRGLHYEIYCKKLSELLGNNNAEMYICLHCESDISNEVVVKLENHNIKKTFGNSIESITKNLSFETNENIETAIDQIAETFKYLDEKYTKAIDEVINK